MCASATASASTSARSSPLMPSPRHLLIALLLALALLGVGGWRVAASSEQRAIRNTQYVIRNTQHVSLAPTPAATISYADYVAALRAAYEAVVGAEGKSAGEQATAAQTALAALPTSAQVGREGGAAPVAVDTDPVRGALTTDPPDLTLAEGRLRALLDLLAPGTLPVPTALPDGTPMPAGVGGTTPPVGGPVDDQQATRQLDQVLADPRFQYEQRTTLQQRLSAALRPLVETLFTMDPLPRAGLVGGVAGLIVTFILYIAYSDRPWSRGRRLARAATFGAIVGVIVAGAMLFGGPLLGALGPVAPYLLGAGGILAAGLAIAVAVTGLRRGRGVGVARLPLTAAEANWTAAHAQTAAAEAATGGDYRRAIRYRYLATMLELDEADRLHFDRALTNLEHLRRAPVHLREALRPLVLTFDRVWYGGSPATAADYQQYTALAQAVEATPAEPEAPA